MKEIFGSEIKVKILMYLALRGPSSGRDLAKVLGVSASQIFKALRQYTQQGILIHAPYGYAMNRRYFFYKNLLEMLLKEYKFHAKKYKHFLPYLKETQKIDPIAVYELIALREKKVIFEKLSDVLRKNYA